MKVIISALAITFAIMTDGYSQVNSDIMLADPVHLEYFFDGLMNDHLRSKHVAGAVVAIVKDGNLVFIKGYGYSDYADRKPVNPDSTLFRIGSISKTFTWTAVMQLVGQGKIKLDEDVNVYLKDLKIPEGEGGPVTLRHLMTHTPGFEDRLIGIFANDTKALRPYGEILKEQLPERVRPAGAEMSYSNHGAAIAAHIVEQVSGLSWEDYVERYILQPLGMNHTTFRQPLPEHLSGMESKGYNYENGALKEYEFELVPLSAVGGASSTASDMSRFMITHLQHGTYQDVTILDSISSSMMQSAELRVSPYTSGIGLGIYELVNWKGIQTIGHGGDTFWFHSLMALIPDKDLGFFISFNSQAGDYAQVFTLFMDHFYPLATPKMSIRLERENADKFTGEFRFNRYPYNDLTRIISMAGTVKMSFDSSGYLLSRARDLQKWLVVNDSTFIREDGEEYLAFGKMENGKYSRASFGNLAVVPLERVPFTDSVNLHITVLASCLIVFILTFICWPAVYLVRRKYSINAGEQKILPAFYKWTGWISSFLVLFFFTGLISALSNPWEIFYGVPPAIKIILIVPLILCLLFALSVYQSFKLIISKEFNLSGKVHFYAVTLALFLLLWQLNHWNLLGFKY